MLTRRQVNLGVLSGALLSAAPALGQDKPAGPPRPLPPVSADGGMTLMAALRQRRSTRAFADRPLPDQLLGDLLWAANGINRPDSGDRTAPCWRHIQAIDLYVTRADGAWLYDPAGHRLLPRSSADIRGDTGMQDFVATAAANLVYVAQGDKLTGLDEAGKRLWATANTGFIGQNVYLFCAAAGLATVFRASVEGARVAVLLGLPAGHFVTGAQSIGYPKAAS